MSSVVPSAVNLIGISLNMKQKLRFYPFAKKAPEVKGYHGDKRIILNYICKCYGVGEGGLEFLRLFDWLGHRW